MAPTIVCVPGLWEGPTVYELLSQRLRAAGFEVEVASLVSTGTTSPNNPRMTDDVAAIRKTILPVVEAGKELILVLHSAGGFLGSSATSGLEASTRAAAGQKGGVVHIIFLAAGVVVPGSRGPTLPFVQFNEDGSMTCKSPREMLFHDVENASRWEAVLKPQPAEGWDEEVSYAGWQHVPSTYVTAKHDKLLPLELQQQLAGVVQAKVEELDSGHMLPLTKPDEIVAIIKKAAA